MNSSEWSLSLGCWGGVHVRMHATLPLMAICALLWGTVAVGGHQSVPTDRVLMIIVVGLSAVVFHAAGHLLAASRRGIQNNEIVLAPWGELNTLQAPANTEAALHMHLSGIMANAFVCALTAMTLWLAHDWTISDLMNPFGSKLLLQGESHLVTLRWAFWLNYLLVLVNLLPAHPFDMHRMVQAAMSLFAPHLDENITYNACVITGRLFSLLLVLSALFAAQTPPLGLLPSWFVLASLGLLGLFATDVRPLRIPDLEQQDDATTFVEQVMAREEERTRPEHLAAMPPELGDEGPFAQWMQERRESARKNRQEVERNEEKSADELLARVHEKGLADLTAEEKSLLERVSARVRRRLKRST